ncbi:MAG: hypothetical protein KF791_20630 [Verrucomicrobiae bacterium]|nr:hypothetical protein [Verrucomicrobiae bacterium]
MTFPTVGRLRLLSWVCLIGVARLAAGGETGGMPAPGARWIVGITPFLEPGARDAVFRSLGRFVLEGMSTGSRLEVYDAFHLKTVAVVSIPEAMAFRSSRTRANQFAGDLNRLRQFLAAGPGLDPAAGPALTNAVRLPQFLDFLFENAAATGGDGDPLVILVLGSPLYVDPKEPDCSMRDGYFPSDGHLLAQRDRTVFGKGSRDIGLSNAVLHLGYFGDPWISDVHRERVQRFWHLYATRRGLRPGRFSADLPTVFAAVTRGTGSAGDGSTTFHGGDLDSKVEMVRITRDAGATDWITRDLLAGSRPPPPRSRTGPMKIGIRWRGDVDLDLYARPREGAETLFFEHVRSPEGFYFKDHRSSPDREYEFIEFESPVDVDRVQARINHFAGDAPQGSGGEVRIEFDGRIYSGEFQLASRRGNEGREGRGQDPFWTEIDVPGILGLRGRFPMDSR